MTNFLCYEMCWKSFVGMIGVVIRIYMKHHLGWNIIAWEIFRKCVLEFEVAV